MKPACDRIEGFGPWFRRSYRQMARFSAQMGTPEEMNDMIAIFKRTSPGD